MSQVTLLDEVSQWNQETCQQELKSVLPKLVISFTDCIFRFKVVEINVSILVLRICIELFSVAFSLVLNDLDWP